MKVNNVLIKVSMFTFLSDNLSELLCESSLISETQSNGIGTHSCILNDDIRKQKKQLKSSVELFL